MGKNLDVNSTVISGATALFFIILFVFTLTFIDSSRKKIEWIDKKLSSIQNIVAFLSILIAILTIWITSKINKQYEKNSKLDAVIVDGRETIWDTEYHYEKLPYTLDENGHLEYLVGPEQEWYVCITNSGNSTAKNVVVEISLDHYAFNGFFDPPNDYILKGANYGFGTCNYIARSYNSIQPNTRIILPPIPFGIMEKFDCVDNKHDCKESTYLHVTIYEDDNIEKSFKFQCEYFEDDVFSGTCFHNSDEQNPVLELNALRYNDFGSSFGNPIFTYADCKTFFKNHPEISSSDFQAAYFYYLRKLKVFNPSVRIESRENCIFYGRVYYMSLNEDNIDSKINNDIFSYTGTFIS